MRKIAVIGCVFILHNHLAAQNNSYFDLAIGINLSNYQLERSITTGTNFGSSFTTAPNLAISYTVPKINSGLELSGNYNILVSPYIPENFGTIFYQKYSWFLNYIYHFKKVSIGIGYGQMAYRYKAFISPQPEKINYGVSHGLNFIIRGKIGGLPLEFRHNLIYDFFIQDPNLSEELSIRTWVSLRDLNKEIQDYPKAFLPVKSRMFLSATLNANGNPYLTAFPYQNDVNFNFGFTLEYFYQPFNTSVAFQRSFWLDFSAYQGAIISTGYSQFNYLGFNHYFNLDEAGRYLRVNASHAWIAERNMEWQVSNVEKVSLYPNRAFSLTVGYSLLPRLETTLTGDYYYKWSPANFGGMDWTRLRFGLRYLLF